MSVEYDFYFQSVLLMDARADPRAKNSDGHQAILGIDGGKTESEAWDHPITMLKAASDKAELEKAFRALEAADLSGVNKSELAMVGMKKRKQCADDWDVGRFMAVMKKL